MTDIHSHLIYRMDDGAIDLEESIALLKEAESIGITNLIVTPSYKDEIEDQVEQMTEKLERIKQRAQMENIQINLHLGNEIPINKNIGELLYEKKVLPLADSHYVLIQLPKYKTKVNLDDLINEILEEGFSPIFASPELCPLVQENTELLIKWMEKGVLFQSNMGSIVGYYGKKAKKTIVKLLNRHMIQILAFDVKKKGTLYADFSEIEKNIKKIVTDEEWEDLVKNNPEKILAKEEISVKIPEEEKKMQIWNWLK